MVWCFGSIVIVWASEAAVLTITTRTRVLSVNPY